MDPARKRTTRLVIALSVAVLLAGALIYTSFSAATEAQQPSQVIHDGKPGKSYQVTGTVAAGSVRHAGDALLFRIRDRKGSESLPVRYTGEVPDPFREGREVIIKGSLVGDQFIGERDSLVTKCPSKFKKKNSQ